jgi:predicted CoA-binding protein
MTPIVNPTQLLKSVRTILVIDWPSKDVPESLVRAGFQVTVRGGPGPTDYAAYELSNGKVVERKLGRAPERAELIYTHRRFSELPGIIAMAKNIQAGTIWTQSGLSAAGANNPKGCWAADHELQAARILVEAAGLNFIWQPYIGDAAREIEATR